jgi:hypothetical protein
MFMSSWFPWNLARQHKGWTWPPHSPGVHRCSTSLTLEQLEDRNLLSGLTPGGLTLGPLVQVSGTSPFAPQPGFYSSAEVEPYLAVNPTNPKNMVGVWTQDMLTSGGGGQGIGVAVTFNGGKSWKTGVMPGVTLASGGAYQAAGDSWLSFAPNGDLYFTCLSADAPAGNFSPSPSAILFEKSTDRGLTWTSPSSPPITLIQSTNPKVFPDKPSITADSTAKGYAYAVWDQSTTSGKGPVMFTRTTDGGQSWETPRTIYDSGNNQVDIGNQILVLPNGALCDFFNVFPFKGGNHSGTLSLIQSSDKGRTWSSTATQVSSMLSVGITDPDTGQPVDAWPAVMFDVAVDPHNGNLYAVWQDARFSNFQHDSIAFSMSTDGGVTWSAPIQINQTPTNIPSGDQQAFLPSIAVAADGTVAVTYYDFRFNDATPGLATDYWLVEGNPTGSGGLANPANWGNEVRLTNQSFDMEKAAVWSGKGLFLGDYQGFAAAGNSFGAFFAATNGSDPGDIFFRDLAADARAPAAVPGNDATPVPPSNASPPPSVRSIDPAALSVALSLSQLPATPASATSPMLWFSPAPLLAPSLTSNLPPAGKDGSSQRDWTAEAASDRFLANLDAGLSLALLVDDLALIGASSDDLTASNPQG